jgi:hypothetical protein
MMQTPSLGCTSKLSSFFPLIFPAMCLAIPSGTQKVPMSKAKERIYIIWSTPYPLVGQGMVVCLMRGLSSGAMVRGGPAAGVLLAACPHSSALGGTSAAS